MPADSSHPVDLVSVLSAFLSLTFPCLLAWAAVRMLQLEVSF